MTDRVDQCSRATCVGPVGRPLSQACRLPKVMCADGSRHVRRTQGSLSLNYGRPWGHPLIVWWQEPLSALEHGGGLSNIAENCGLSVPSRVNQPLARVESNRGGGFATVLGQIDQVQLLARRNTPIGGIPRLFTRSQRLFTRSQ